MALFGIFKTQKEKVNEAIEAFAAKNTLVSKKAYEKTSGEGISDIYSSSQAFGSSSLGSLSMFYNKYINVTISSEKDKIYKYREMAAMPEIADVLEDAVIESIEEDEIGNIISLQIVDAELEKNKNAIKVIQEEFDDLFYKKIDISTEKMFTIFSRFYEEGRVYYERIIDTGNKSKGIINIKFLPAETMYFAYDQKSGEILWYCQMLKSDATPPKSKDDAEKNKDKYIIFEPSQIGFIYNKFGKVKNEIIGFLDKVKVPYNQVKLLESSVIIYRLIRAPERLVFKIDTGNMPKDKALAYVNKLKGSLTKKVTFDPITGNVSNDSDPFTILENFFIPVSDGKSSSIESIGGNPSGFKELDDLYYFQKKLYRAMKYPLSRVESMQTGQSKDILNAGSDIGKITRDEIKWSKLLERNQTKIANEFKELFLLHLEFKGLKSEYSLDTSKIRVKFRVPNDYKIMMNQNILKSKFEAYSSLSSNEEFSKVFLMKLVMNWDDEMLRQNKECLAKDKDFGLAKDKEAGGLGF